MENCYEAGLQQTLEKVAFIGLLGKGLGAIGGRMLGAGSRAVNYGRSMIPKIPGQIRSATSTDFSKIKSAIGNSDSFGKAKNAITNSESYKLMRGKYDNIKNSYETLNKTHPNAVKIGLGTAGLVGGGYMGNKMYRSLQRIGSQIPDGYNEVQ